MTIHNFGRMHDANSYYGKAVTIPANTSTTSSALQTEGGQDSQLEVAVIAATAVTLAAAAVLKVILQTSAEESTSYQNILSREVSDTGALSFAKGDVIAVVPIPSDALKYTRVVVETNDAAATGTIDIPIQGSFHAR